MASSPTRSSRSSKKEQLSPKGSSAAEADAAISDVKQRFQTTGSLFPMGYKEGFSQWWTAVTPAIAESRVLSFLPFNKPESATSVSEPHSASTTNPASADPHGPRTCASAFVPLSGKNRSINEFTVTRISEPDPENHLVMLHGYGAGLAFFYKNYDMLSRLPGWKLWSLDLLGYGRSSRPSFVIKAKDPEGKITEAEDWFIDALEEWRKIRGIERFTLLGHSFGGYLSVRYALKYQGRVNKLILASPVGVPEDPYAIRNPLPDAPQAAPSGSELGLQNEFLQQQDELTKSNPNLPGTLSDAEDRQTSSAPGSIKDGKTGNAPPRRPIPKWLSCLWDANISPFSFVRWAGPLGPRLVSGWSSRRFSALPKDESQALHDYAYSLFRQSGSGEYALAYVLAPGAFARRPLIWKVQDLVTGGGRSGGIPSVWMYGDGDWMDITGGFAAEEKIKKLGGEASVKVVLKAGHHLYLDGWEQFNQMVLEEMKDVEKREKKWKSSMAEETQVDRSAVATATA